VTAQPAPPPPSPQFTTTKLCVAESRAPTHSNLGESQSDNRPINSTVRLLGVLRSSSSSTRRSPPRLLCHCGRRCRGLRGLKAHQRGCGTLNALLDVDPLINRAAYNFISSAAAACTPQSPTTCHTSLKPVAGLRLPRSSTEAQAYFLTRAPPANMDAMSPASLDDCANEFQEAIYSYFSSATGLHRPRDRPT